MDFMSIYDAYEERIQQITEVTTAEENFKKILDNIAAYNTELADRADMLVGALARAYEAQGFNGGLTVARGTL